jgi:hypothetical protein
MLSDMSGTFASTTELYLSSLYILIITNLSEGENNRVCGIWKSSYL